MNWQTLEVSVQDRVAKVTLNRPDVRNAFNETMIAELAQAFRALGAADEVRMVVLAAHGSAFCAGADLNWMKKMAGYTYEQNRADAAELALMLKVIYECPKPVVARVHGDCYAGGMGLVAACDIIVAAAEANFCLSEVRLGLIPATISPYVVKAMGQNASRRYFLTAERFSAREAAEIGFVHACVPAQELDATVASITGGLLAASPNAVREAKRLVRDVAGAALTEHLVADTVGRIAFIRASDEGKEGVASFLEKRKPSWLQ